jgi:hypothetical protein
MACNEDSDPDDDDDDDQDSPHATAPQMPPSSFSSAYHT